MDKGAASCLLSIAGALSRASASLLEARAHCEELAALLGEESQPTTAVAPAQDGINIDRPHRREAVATQSAAAPRYSGAPPKFSLNGRPVTVRELAALAGCSKTAMHERLTAAGLSPEAAVAMGRSHRVAPRRPRVTDAGVAPPAPTFPKSVFEPAPPPVVTVPRAHTMAPRPQPPQVSIAPVAFKPGQQAIVPDDVKRTVAPTPRERFAGDDDAMTFGRIGEYEDTGSALSRALGGRT
jgi:hypothetical protein